MKNIEKSKRVKNRPYPLFQPQHIERIKNYLQTYDPECWLFVRFVFYCAIRPGKELVNLKVQDINFHDWTITVHNDIAKNDNHRISSIPISFREDVKAAFYYALPGQFLFPDPKNRTRDSYYKRMYDRHCKALKQLGFPKGYCVYSWRYTGAVMAAKAGVPLNQIKEQFDHHSLDQLYGYMRQAGFIDRGLLVDKYPSI